MDFEKFNELGQSKVEHFSNIEGDVPPHMSVEYDIRRLPIRSSHFCKKILGSTEAQIPSDGHRLWIDTGKKFGILDDNGDKIRDINQLVRYYNALIDQWNQFIAQNKRPTADKWKNFIQI